MTGYVYGATRTTTDLRKAGRLIHQLRRDLTQATTERDAAQVELRRTAAQRDLLERHIEEMRQARTERLRAIEIATRPAPGAPPVDYSPGAGSHRLALAAAEMEEWAARNPPTRVLRKRHLEATRYLTKKRGTPA
ncbi:hypothetical protein [Micrococcus luteus]|uniref:hypothetical protein n=1 Tax=Micrococcus luteus TaxID=1270 RepID=UPI0023022660|nr:hypothetical protein [Micrococcus luteus]